MPPPLDGGVTPVDGPVAGCTNDTVNPCTTIPSFTGTQTVDGKDDDMCQVPLFAFIKPAAGAVTAWHDIQDADYPVVTARIGWSAAGLHVFFDVADSSVQTVDMADPGQVLTAPYQGDSIELFFSASDNATGAPGGDNAMQVTLAPTGKSVSVKTVNDNGISTTYTELPAGQAVGQVKADGGYVVEALVPWPGSPPSAGSRVRFDLGVNIADTTFTNVGDMRDAQMTLNLTTVSGQTSCPGAAEPYCDDRTWCSTTLQ